MAALTDYHKRGHVLFFFLFQICSFFELLAYTAETGEHALISFNVFIFFRRVMYMKGGAKGCVGR